MRVSKKRQRSFRPYSHSLGIFRAMEVDARQLILDFAESGRPLKMTVTSP